MEATVTEPPENTKVPAGFTFPVEAGHVAQFAHAVADPNPVYRDAEYAAGLR